MVPLSLGVLAIGSVLGLLAWEIAPGRFPAHSHDVLGAAPLALIALAYLAYQAWRRPSRFELLKALLLTLAFLFWAANQAWPNYQRATLFNDIAVALFVLDVFFVIGGWPHRTAAESFAEVGD